MDRDKSTTHSRGGEMPAEGAERPLEGAGGEFSTARSETDERSAFTERAARLGAELTSTLNDIEMRDVVAQYGDEGATLLGHLLTTTPPGASLRRLAVLALEDLGPRAVGALPAIIETAGNPKEKADTRRYANGVLRELGSAAQEAVPTLIETAQERGNDFMVRLTAIGALSAVGSELPAVSSALRALARAPGEEPEIREAAARASGGSRRPS